MDYEMGSEKRCLNACSARKKFWQPFPKATAHEKIANRDIFIIHTCVPLAYYLGNNWKAHAMKTRDLSRKK